MATIVHARRCRIDDFVDYASRFDPSFESHMRGATPQEIEELQRVCGHALPETYHCFLSRMGREIGPLLRMPWDCWMEVRNLTEYYREEVARGEAHVPGNCILIALSGLWPEKVYLQLNPPREPKVLADYDAPSASVEADSLANALSRMVFNIHGMAAFPHGVALASRDRSPGYLTPARELALDSSFQPEWFSDSVAFCGTRNGAAISCTQIEGRELVVSLAGLVSSEVERMRTLLMERLPLERIHWKR